MHASLSVKPMFAIACNWLLNLISGLSCSACRKMLKDSLKFAAGLFGFKPLSTWDESGSSCWSAAASAAPRALAFAAGLSDFALATGFSSAAKSAVMESCSTACWSIATECTVGAWNIWPMKLGSRKGSSGCSFLVGPGMVCVSCDSSCCMFWSCIIEAIAFVSNVPAHSGRGLRPLAGPDSSSGSSASEALLGALEPVFEAEPVSFWSFSGLWMSSHMCRSTSIEPPERLSNAVVARSVLRSTSRTCTGFLSFSAASPMNSWSCNISISSGLLSRRLLRRGSVLMSPRMKSKSFSRLCMAGDSSICCRMSGFCSTWRCKLASWLGSFSPSSNEPPSPPGPPAPPVSRWMVLFRSTP
mmetsp:Transcript_13090/g.34815  ORF Transcript_13090/g.34815 Transcript_13090/m.34815 type:complete len:357 (+) Transcript_13090:205-1275(+)